MGDALRRNLAATELEPDCAGNCGGNQAGAGEGREFGQPCAVGKLRQQPARDGECKPRLADAAGTGQGNEAMRGAEVQDLVQLDIAANQFRNWLR